MTRTTKTMNGVTTILLILMCLGFMNQGTLISLILFAIMILANNGRISAGNWSEFITAVLFAVTFLLFGFISGVRTAYIGILVPVGYCIGASLDCKKSEDIDNLVLLLALSMDAHLILNLINEIIRYGLSFRLTAIHYDIWSGQLISSTGAMINATAFLGCIYYLMFKSSKKKRIIGISLLIINTLYDLIMGGRSFLVILFVGILVGFIADTVRSNGAGAALKKIIVGSVIAIVIILGYFVLSTNSSFLEFYRDTYFYKRFFRENAYENILMTGRTNLRQIYLSNMWNYPFGGRKIWNIAHQYAHELYLDIYDIGGVVPYVLIIVFVVQTIVSCIKVLKSEWINNGTSILLICFFACLNAQFFIEPVLSGAPTCLAVYCIVAGYLSKCTRKMQQGAETVA